MTILEENITANATGTEFAFAGGKANVTANGVYDGGKLSLEYSRPSTAVGADVFTLVNKKFYTDFGYNIELPACNLRWVMEDAGSGVDVDAFVEDF